MDITYFTDDEEIFLIKDDTTLHRKPGIRISLLPIFGAVKVVSRKEGLVEVVINGELRATFKEDEFYENMVIPTEIFSPGAKELHLVHA